MGQNKKLDIKKIMQYTQSVIDDSLNSVSDLSDFQTLQMIKARSNGLHEWIPELVKDLLNSLNVFNTVANITGQANFDQDYMAKVEKDQSKVMTINLTIQATTEAKSKVLSDCVTGGKGEYEGKTYTVDKSSSFINEENVQEAANKLRNYFVQSYKKKYGDGE